MYLSCAVYNAPPALTANPKNPAGLFETEAGLSEAVTNGRMHLHSPKSRACCFPARKKAAGDAVQRETPAALNSKALSAAYPEWAPSLLR